MGEALSEAEGMERGVTTRNRTKLARERAGLSVGQACKLLGLAREVLLCVEETDSAFNDIGDVRERMADIYGVNPEWLAGDVPRHNGLPRPGEPCDQFGGFSIEVCQVDWGHVARKRTWLYIVGISPSVLTFPPPGTPTHWIGSFRISEGRQTKTYRTNGSARPPGIKACSAQQRRRTPPAFAAWLVDIAQRAAR